MPFATVFRKVLLCGTSDNLIAKEEKGMREEDSPSPSEQGGVVSLLAAKHPHKTFPPESEHIPHPSHFSTEPVLPSDDATFITESPQSSPTSSPQVEFENAIQSTSSSSPKLPRNPRKRQTTIELEE